MRSPRRRVYANAPKRLTSLRLTVVGVVLMPLVLVAAPVAVRGRSAAAAANGVRLVLPRCSPATAGRPASGAPADLSLLDVNDPAIVLLQLVSIM
jgi:hypothetical protein